MIRVTGAPRSGTGYVAALLKNAGLDVGHETVGKDGTVSWLHAGEGKVSWLQEEVKQQHWDNTIHLVRNPIDVISSFQTLSDEAFNYMFYNLKDHPLGDRSLRWYMWAWLKWNSRIEEKCASVFRVEDLKKGKVLDSFLEAVEAKNTTFGLPPDTTNARTHSQYSWIDLKKEDFVLYEMIKEKAVKYGYKVFSFGAVMMAKNEAHNLHRCLKSIKDVVDEIILVDTGSSDGTIGIAKMYGAKVFNHPWQDNFSLHRNQSLSYSSCDWVLQIDCDEELCGDGPLLYRFAESLHNSHFNASAIMIKDIHKGKSEMQFNAARIFRREAVHFEDIVHNRPVFDGDAAMPSGGADYWLCHYGYDLDADKKAAKLARTKGLLEKRIKNNRKDWNAYFYLSQVYGELGDDEKVLENCEKYINNKDRIEKFNRSVYYTHLQVLKRITGYDKKFEDTLNKYMNELPTDLDITLMAIIHAKDTNKAQLLKSASDRFIHNFDRYAKDAHAQASRFTYSFNNECLSLALFYHTILNLEEGIKGLNAYGNLLSKLDGEFKIKAQADMEFACKKIGINWTHNGG